MGFLFSINSQAVLYISSGYLSFFPTSSLSARCTKTVILLGSSSGVVCCAMASRISLLLKRYLFFRYQAAMGPCRTFQWE